MFSQGFRLVSLIGLGFCSACTTDEQLFPVSDEVGTYVGALEGSDAIVAVSISGNDVVAYVCGGEATYATRTKWFRGPLDLANHTAVVEASDGSRMELAIDSEEAMMSGVLGDTRIELARIESGDGDPRGLFTTIDDGCRTGVIVFGEPGALRVQGTWCRTATDGESIFAQVTPILPIAITDDALRVRVILGEEGDRMLVAHRVDPEALR